MSEIPSNVAASCLIQTTFDDDVITRAVRGCRNRIGGAPDIVFAFVSSDWAPHLKEFAEIVQVEGHARTIMGCSGHGLIGVGQEDENISGMSLLFLKLPNTTIHRIHLSEADIEKATSETPWQKITGVESDDFGSWLNLGNPLKLDSDNWLAQWNESYPRVPCFGGLASGGTTPEELFLFDEKGKSSAAMIAAHFEGGVRLGGVVSQGCRPIGEPFTITEVDRNVLVSIGGRKAYEVLEEAFESLPEEDQADAKGNIFAGLAMSEYVDNYKRGDFLVRNIIGGDPEAGVIALSGFPRVGQTMQFQLRDKDTADEDLRNKCAAAQTRYGEPFASLIFSCAGRGVSLFEEPNHDAGIFEEVFGKVPASGFFCNGEIGPVGGENFIHAYTASSALFLNP